MKEKMGFTLIELLAVIVILGIIMLIAIPLILNVINDARLGSFKNSTYGIIKAAENDHLKMMMENRDFEELSFFYNDGNETSNVHERKLDYRGTKPVSGTVIINKEGKVGVAIHNGKWCAEKGFEESVVKLTNKTQDDCKLLVIPPKEEIYEDETGAAIPVVEEGMIPIIWDGSKWVKASINQKWYDYKDKEWANVVLVTSETRNEYISSAVGTEIKEVDVLAYLVWIPRYKYKLFNVEALATSPTKIEIIFESKSIAKSTGSTNGTYLTHPAFTFGDKELDGFWIGKFETTGTLQNLTVKPNIASLRSLNISSVFNEKQKFNKVDKYGLTTKSDAHLLKNIEWGATTYLSYSLYGKNDNVTLNGSALTGGGNYILNTVQSTTGNIYGVYDMSGGAWEYVMGNQYNVDNTTMFVQNTGFNQEIIDSGEMSKYIDKYTYGTTYSDQLAYNRRKLGDATGETRSWNGNYSTFILSSYGWFIRGGHYSGGASSGVFAFETHNGGANASFGFRLAVS